MATLAANQRPLTPIVVDFMYKRRVAEVLLDFCLITASYYTAYRLRFEDPEEFLRELRELLAVAAGRRRRRSWSRSSSSASIAACGATSA